MKKINAIYPKVSSPCNCMNTRRASRAVTLYYDEALKPCGLTIAQLGLLRHIQGADMPTISEVAKSFRIDRTTLNRNLKPLAQVGFITIQPGEDSRTRQIAVTEAGSKAMAEGARLWDVAQTEIKEYLGSEDLATLTRLLAKLEALVP
jgi:DNA-binding MarR family transcriptional regulator